MDGDEPLLSTEDVAKYFNVEVVTIRRLVSRGELGAYKIGGEFRFSQTDVRDYLQRQHIPAHNQLAVVPQTRSEIISKMPVLIMRRLMPGKSKDEFARFTKSAKRMLSAARGEAQRFSYPHISTGHLLLSAIQVQDGVAAAVLRELGVNYEQARQAMTFVIEPSRAGAQTFSEQDQLTPHAKNAIEAAITEADALDHKYVGSEHLLLGLTNTAENLAMQVLKVLGVDALQVRTATLNMLGSSGPR